jgi:prepilin-type N-terminal cleavage/methylation domain-containing protein
MITNKNKSGFTFLEVMIAVSVLALVLTAVFRLYSQSVSMLFYTGFDLKAPLLAEKIISEKKTENNFFSDDQGDFGEDFRNYSWSTKVSDVEISDLSGTIPEQAENIKMQKVTVTVTNINKNKYTTFFYVYK